MEGFDFSKIDKSDLYISKQYGLRLKEFYYLREYTSLNKQLNKIVLELYWSDDESNLIIAIEILKKNLKHCLND